MRDASQVRSRMPAAAARVNGFRSIHWRGEALDASESGRMAKTYAGEPQRKQAPGPSRDGAPAPRRDPSRELCYSSARSWRPDPEPELLARTAPEARSVTV